MSAHTSGPWKFYEDNNYGGTVELGTSGATVTVDRADRFTSALVISRDEMNANGHLIAAAPDLLAACEASISRCRLNCTPESYCGQCEPLLAAIAKARGGK